MDDQPLITIILPTYQRPLMLKRAIQSVLNQNYLTIKCASMITLQEIKLHLLLRI